MKYTLFSKKNTQQNTFSQFLIVINFVVRNKQPLKDSTVSLSNTTKIYKHTATINAFETTNPSNNKIMS